MWGDVDVCVTRVYQGELIYQLFLYVAHFFDIAHCLSDSSMEGEGSDHQCDVGCFPGFSADFGEKAGEM